MAALTNELDTLAITTKVKEILMAHNVGQKVSIATVIITIIVVILTSISISIIIFISIIAEFEG